MTEVALALVDGRFGPHEVEWGPRGPEFRPCAATPSGLVAPGFVDLHVHGGIGADTMDGDTAATMRWLDWLRERGCEGVYPTTVTACAEEVARAVAALPESPLVLGFHLEGPFISPAFPGAQRAEGIERPPVGPSSWDGVLEHPRLRRVTLAPERPGALGLIRRLAHRGVQASLGHSDATSDETRSAVEAGLRHATHTFNAMRAFHHREPGAVGAVLAEDRIDAELVYDGRHVSRLAAEILLRCKGLDRVVAVSDGTAAAGLPDGSSVTMWGRACLVSGGTVRLAGSSPPTPPSVSRGTVHPRKTEGGAPENGALAGSTATLLDCFQNLSSDFGPEVAVRLCCVNPRRVAGLKGSPSVWLRFDRASSLLDVVPC